MGNTTSQNKGRIFGLFQRIGRSFMLPIALLPIAGLLLGVGSSMTNATTIATYHLEWLLGEGTLLNGLMQIFSGTGNIIFANLPLLFAMGIALGMTEQERGTAVLSAAIAFFVMHQTISTMLLLSGKLEAGAMPEGSLSSVLGIRSLEMGVFGGIVVGLGVAWLHNRFYRIQLPAALSFFGGVRFIPIIATVVYLVVGGIAFFVWPIVQLGITKLGEAVLASGYFGTFLYGFIERALIPFGLHHVFYLPFWQTGVGGSAVIDGVTIYGAQNIFFAELASPETGAFSVSATRFMSGKFPLMIFGLPGAALAMYLTAKPEKRKTAGSLLLSAAVTSMLTGITEPLEFTFLFVAPFLYYGVHCVLAGLSYMLMHVFQVGVGMTFSGGIIDLFLYGILQGNEKTNWIAVLPIGVAYFLLYLLLFYCLIRKRNYITPGREELADETRLYTRKDVEAARKTAPSATASDASTERTQLSEAILRGLGGKENIRNLDACATRLRVTVADETKIREELLRQTGAAGVLQKGTSLQIVYGPSVTVIKSDLELYLQTLESEGGEL